MTWYRSDVNDDGKRLLDRVVPSSRIGTLVTTGGLKHVLRFKSVREADLGVYTCRAENSLGQAEAAVEMSGNKIFSLFFYFSFIHLVYNYINSCYTLPLSRRPSLVIFLSKVIR